MALSAFKNCNNMRMFLVPATPTHAEEADAWAGLASGALAIESVHKTLCECR